MSATDVPPTTRRWTADEVWQMVEIGLLEEDEPYELLDGELLYVSPQGITHEQVITRLTMLLASLYGSSGNAVRVQCSVGGIPDSIPEPDLAVVSVDIAERNERPRPHETILIIEVGVTSQRRDRRKGEIYASAGAPMYWRVDIPRDLVIVHADPRPDGTWEEITGVGPDGMLRLPGLSESVAARRFLRPMR